MGQLVDGKWSTENVLFNHDEARTSHRLTTRHRKRG